MSRLGGASATRWSTCLARTSFGLEHDDTTAIPPGTVEDLVTIGSQSAITLRWTPPPDYDVKGYDVYRATSPLGPWARINEYTADGSALYVDADLPGLTRYYYYVVARDSSYNESTPSLTISGTTNPPLKRGWPVAMAQETQSSAWTLACRRRMMAFSSGSFLCRAYICSVMLVQAPSAASR